jgi:hypothetical protein
MGEEKLKSRRGKEGMEQGGVVLPRRRERPGSYYFAKTKYGMIM